MTNPKYTQAFLQGFLKAAANSSPAGNAGVAASPSKSPGMPSSLPVMSNQAKMTNAGTAAPVAQSTPAWNPVTTNNAPLFGNNSFVSHNPSNALPAGAQQYLQSLKQIDNSGGTNSPFNYTTGHP